MTTFWELWNAAEKGDIEAAHQVNVLVYQHLMRDKVDNSDGWLDRVTWDDLPHELDYMSDLNAIMPLFNLAQYNVVILGLGWDTPRWDVEIQDNDTDNIVAHCKNELLVRALVGAWWAAVTGEKQPE